MHHDYFTDPESRAFLQHRIARFALVGTVIGAAAMVFRIILALIFGYFGDEIEDPTTTSHAAAIAASAALWLICSRGQYSVAVLSTMEAAGLVAIAVCYVWMGTGIPPEAGAVTVTCFILSIVLFARAVFVPSTAAHTVWLAFLMWIPLAFGMYHHYLGVNLEVWRTYGWDDTARSTERVAWAQVLGSVTWWSLVTGLAALASRVIHGLRQEVRDIKRLGQYAVEDTVGEGGMGVVYRATHGMLKRPTAVKVLKPGVQDPTALARFRREVQLTAKLTHPNTVTIYDYGRTPDGQFYYAMELLDGANLKQIVDIDGAQPAGRVSHVLHDAAMALHEAHEIGLIHRDIKPSNIMLARQGGLSDVVKVMDFGLVKSTAAPDDASMTQTEAIKGTPHYLSPESIKAPDVVDARSDLYALGAVGYYLLSGRPVFDAPTIIELCMAHLDKTPEPLSSVCASPVPPALEQCIMKCLAKDRSDRPASALELADGLAKLDIAWHQAQAREWWSAVGPRLEARGADDASMTSAKTIAVDIGAS